MGNVEQELKLKLSQADFDTLSALSNEPFVKQVNYYFATDVKGQMVRIREKNGEYVLCCKNAIKNDGFVAKNDERECKIGTKQALEMIDCGIKKGTLESFFDVAQSKDLLAVGSLTTFRKAFFIGKNHVELDRNEYLGVTDYELECESDSELDLIALKNTLANVYGVKILPSKPKSQRFFEKLCQNNGNF